LMERPVGPHPIGMFEVNVFSPEQFGAFVGWLVVWRGQLSALVHPNTGDDRRDHEERATWWVSFFFYFRVTFLVSGC
jgi:aromatic ring-cleaving dioxygenase